KQKQSRTIADAEANRDERLRVINETYARRKVETQTKLARDMREAVDAHDKQMAELPVKHEAGLQKLVDKYEALKEKIRTHHETSWNSMAARWHEGMANVQTSIGRVNSEVIASAPRWDGPAWPGRPFPKSVPAMFRIGETRVDIDQMPG